MTEVTFEVEVGSPQVEVESDKSGVIVEPPLTPSTLFDVEVQSGLIQVDADTAGITVDGPRTEAVPAGGPTVIFAATPVPGPPGSGGGGTSEIVSEVLGGVVNGVNAVFSTANVYAADSTAVYRNGVREVRGVGYTETGPQQITFSDAPWNGDIVSIDYGLA